MKNADDVFTCTKCGEEFKRWSDNRKVLIRCLNCSLACVRRFHEAPPQKTKCALCETTFTIPDDRRESKRFCSDCRHMDPYERKLALLEKAGQPIPNRRFREKKQVDNRKFVNVHSLMHESTNVFEKLLADKKVVLVG